MLSLHLEEFRVELKEGSIKNVGATNKAATTKLYDVESVEARPFGDERIKLAFADGEGNEVEVALAPEHADELSDAIAAETASDGESTNQA